MDWILKMLTPQMILALLPMILIKLGNWFKNKDVNNTGADDAFGNILIALAPAMEAMATTKDGEPRETALKKALNGVYVTLGNHLGKTPT